MIRVIYSYEVKAGQEQVFIEAWKRVTRTVRTTSNGARGSLLTRDARDKQQFVAIARWETVEAFVKFNNAGMLGSEADKAMRATLEGGVAMQVVEELHDLTNYDEAKK